MENNLPQYKKFYSSLQRWTVLEQKAQNWVPKQRIVDCIKKLNFWDKSYYGYNRKEHAEQEARWREEVFSSLDQEALPGKWSY